jgi:hypothetical protein
MMTDIDSLCERALEECGLADDHFVDAGLQSNMCGIA